VYVSGDVVDEIYSAQPIKPKLDIKYVPPNGEYVAGIPTTLNSILTSQQLLNDATIGGNDGVIVGVGVGVGSGSGHPFVSQPICL
jgi:hypothetical protein